MSFFFERIANQYVEYLAAEFLNDKKMGRRAHRKIDEIVRSELTWIGVPVGRYEDVLRYVDLEIVSNIPSSYVGVLHCGWRIFYFQRRTNKWMVIIDQPFTEGEICAVRSFVKEFIILSYDRLEFYQYRDLVDFVIQMKKWYEEDLNTPRPMVEV